MAERRFARVMVPTDNLRVGDIVDIFRVGSDNMGSGTIDIVTSHGRMMTVPRSNLRMVNYGSRQERDEGLKKVRTQPTRQVQRRLSVTEPREQFNIVLNRLNLLDPKASPQRVKDTIITCLANADPETLPLSFHNPYAMEPRFVAHLVDHETLENVVMDIQDRMDTLQLEQLKQETILAQKHEQEMRALQSKHDYDQQKEVASLNQEVFVQILQQLDIDHVALALETLGQHMESDTWKSLLACIEYSMDVNPTRILDQRQGRWADNAAAVVDDAFAPWDASDE